jgi:hypothetical protein
VKLTEDPVRRAYENAGYAVFCNGWPDFLVIKNGKGFCVEVKSGSPSGGGELLHEGQAEMHAALHALGLPTVIQFIDTRPSYPKETDSEKETRLLTNARSGVNKLKNNPKRRLTKQSVSARIRL